MIQARFWFPISLLGWKYWLPILIGGGILTVVMGLLIPPLACIAAIVTVAMLLFFRDPLRDVPSDADVMVSPADGRITEISTVESGAWIESPALKVGIFLSVLDVHINRSPCDGVIKSIVFEPGSFLDARHSAAGLKNQSNNLTMETPWGRVVVRQIVGAIARRIICPQMVGDSLTRGERFGMIAFGSRTELMVTDPEGWEPCVKVGEKVFAGQTIVLRRRRLKTDAAAA